MKKADRILKKCNEYYNLVSTAQEFRNVPIERGFKPLPGGSGLLVPESYTRPMMEAPKPVVEGPKPVLEPGKFVGYEPSDFAKEQFKERVTVPETAPTVAPEVPVEIEVGPQFKFKIEKWKKKNTRPAQTKVGPNGEVTIYVDEFNKPIIDSLPEEVRESLGEKGGKQIAKQINSNIRTKLLSDANIKWNLAEGIGEHVGAAKELAKLQKGKIAGITSGGIATIMILGSLYSLFTKDEPKSKDDFGRKLSDGSKALASKIDTSKLPKNTELKSQVDAVSALTKKYYESSQNPQNKTTLTALSNLLDSIGLNLAFGSLVIDDQGSQETIAKQFAQLNKSISQLFDNRYLERFAKFLESKNDSSNVSLVENCERGLANYRSALVESNSAAQSAKSMTEVTL